MFFNIICVNPGIWKMTLWENSCTGIFDNKNEEQFKTWYESVYNHAYDTKALMSHADDSTDSDESTSTSGSDSRCDEGMEEGET